MYRFIIFGFLRHRKGVNIRAQTLQRTWDLPKQSMDCVISIGAINRAQTNKDAGSKRSDQYSKADIIKEAYRSKLCKHLDNSSHINSIIEFTNLDFSNQEVSLCFVEEDRAGDTLSIYKV